MNRLDDSRVAEMYALYQEGKSFQHLEDVFKRNRSSIREIFKRRGYTLREPTAAHIRRAAECPGCFQAYPPISDERVAEIIGTLTTIKIPDELRLDWRKWPLQRRAAFVRVLRARLNNPNDAPAGPYNVDLVPFDYGTPEAWEIVNELNKGLESKKFAIKLNLNSQGVIFRGLLWFWAHKVGYCRQGPWTHEEGRPVLHHVLWREHHGEPVPPQHALRFIDGNRNNHAIENLQLIHRAELCFENLNGARHRRGRDKLKTILSMNTTTTKDHVAINNILGR